MTWTSMYLSRRVFGHPGVRLLLSDSIQIQTLVGPEVGPFRDHKLRRFWS
jgi:hypothetical protein